MRIKPIESKVNVVLIGNFNPNIFSPHWFMSNGVIEEEDNVDSVSPALGIVGFELSWLSVFVQQNRFVAELEQPPEVRLSDFVQKTFGELLKYTPIWACGINKTAHVGTSLAPPGVWGDWTDGTNEGEMVSLSRRQTITDGRPGGYIQTRVGPSDRSDSAVFIEVNDHYEMKKNVDGCLEIMALLSENFDHSIKKSEQIINQVMGIVR